MGESEGSPGGLTPRSRLKRVEGIAWRVVDREAVLVDVRNDKVIRLDDVGSFIWSRLDGTVSLEDIAAELVEEFEVDLQTALEDTVSFAGGLVEQGAAELGELES